MSLAKKIIVYILIGFSFLSLLGALAIISKSLFGFLFFSFFALLFGWCAFKLNPVDKQDIDDANNKVSSELYKTWVGLKRFFTVVKYEFEQSKLAAQKRKKQGLESGFKPPFQSNNTPEYEITYNDIDGNYSCRQIDIERVYKKSGHIYVDAFCYLMTESRTFRTDRIETMKYCSDGAKVHDVNGFFKRMI